MKKMVMYFDRMTDVHLNKDVGLVAHNISKVFNLDLEYVTADSCNTNNFKGHNVRKIKRFPNYMYNLFFYLYLLVNARKIDFLMTIHCRPYNLFIGMIYKILNPKGKYYIKMDMGPNNSNYNKKIRNEKNDSSKVKTLKLFKKLFRRVKYFPIRFVDLISSEVFEVYNEVKENGFFGFDISDKLTLLINGMDDEYDLQLNEFEEKENLIITVGRLGTHPKNTEFFLDVIEKINLNNWQVKLIGSINEGFQKEIDNFFKNNQNLKSKIEFYGKIKDRKSVLEMYNRAKVFCLTSRYEGFALVFPEARYFCDFILTTDVGGAKEITKNSEMGKVIGQNKLEKFCDYLQNIIDGKIDLHGNYELMKKNRDKITWFHLINNNNKIKLVFGEPDEN